MIEVVVAGLGMHPSSSSPLLLLQERNGSRLLPVGIGPLEAQAVALPLQGVRPPRPMTHDVFVTIIAHLGAHVRRVEIVALREGTFFARLVLERDGAESDVDIRPSDGIALAVRTETPIYVAEAVLDEAGLRAEDVAGAREAGENPSAAAGEAAPLDESKLLPFREFIETLDMGDLDAGGPTDPEPRA